MQEGAGGYGPALWVGPAAGLVAGVLALPLGAPIAWTLGISVWTALWWMLEPVDSAIASLIPFALLPAVGVLSAAQVAQAYGHELILLLAGGFMLSTALERSGAHRRLAILLLRVIGGGSGRRVLAGFSVATALLSMWVSNTASTLMMLPVAAALLDAYPDTRLRTPLVLGVAYAASIGGLGSPLGTPPNLVFVGAYEAATGVHIGFFAWAKFGVPIMALMLAGLVAWLGRGLGGAPGASLPEAGPWRPEERRVLGVFGAVAALWVLRTDPWGGWTTWIGAKGANDASVALAGVVVMAAVPNGRGGRLLDWESAGRIPWGTLVLFGGGIAIAQAFEVSGLSNQLAGAFTGLDGLPVVVVAGVICLSTTMLSEVASNTATAVLLMPVLAASAAATGVDPAIYMLPAALAASCGFMLPIATGPNAIAFGTGWVDARTMMREGFVLDLLGVVVMTLVCWATLG
jgi:sodium-dependent dicarboxylate transporter 2/3/5